MARVVITGGSGKIGRATIPELLAHGWEVINLDTTPPREPLCKYMRTDLTDYGAVYEAFTDIDGGWSGVDAVVHLAAIPGPSNAANAALYQNNSIVSFNVFYAAHRAGIRNVVWASSETLLGVPFTTPPPYVPLDEEIPSTPEWAYSLAKHVEEELAKQLCRWDPTKKMIGLRFSYVKEPAEFAQFAEIRADPSLQPWNLWSYVDSRDCAQAVRLALEYETTGFEAFVIAAADTIMDEPSPDLMARFYPGVPFRREVAGTDSLLASDKARRVLGYAPRHSWRDAPDA